MSKHLRKECGITFHVIFLAASFVKLPEASDFEIQKQKESTRRRFQYLIFIFDSINCAVIEAKILRKKSNQQSQWLSLVNAFKSVSCSQLKLFLSCCKVCVGRNKFNLSVPLRYTKTWNERLYDWWKSFFPIFAVLLLPFRKIPLQFL